MSQEYVALGGYEFLKEIGNRAHSHQFTRAFMKRRPVRPSDRNIRQDAHQFGMLTSNIVV